MGFFWTLWGFNAVMSLIPIYFFFVGLGDGTITSRNMGIWVIILAVIAAILYGSIWLKDHQQFGLGKVILILAAIPGLLFLFYILLVITTKPRWN